MRIEIVFMICGVFLASVSQILLKKSADRAESGQSIPEGSNFIARIRAQYLNKFVIVGYGLMLISMLIPLYAFKFIELKYVAIVESLGYVFIMLLSSVFIKEKITKRKVLGNLIIIAGVIIFGLNITGINLL